jgi:hypothetical protein
MNFSQQQPKKLQKTYCRMVEIDGTKYYVPMGYIMDNQTKESIKNSKTPTQSYIAKNMTINGFEYQVPYHWDELYVKSILE